MGTLFKLQQIPTWKIPNGNNKKKRCTQGSPTFWISSVSDHGMLGKGSEEATLGGAGQSDAGGGGERSCQMLSSQWSYP